MGIGFSRYSSSKWSTFLLARIITLIGLDYFFFLCKNNNNKILKRKVYIASFRGMDC